MFGIDNFAGFLVVGIALNITPGSDTIYILTRSVSQGRKAGIMSVLGISTGSLIHTLCAALGLSMILTYSTALFMAVKYLGAAYIIYLGLRMILGKDSFLECDQSFRSRPDLWKIYRQGVLTNVLNPKVALFFLTFLPQFIDPANTYGPLPFLLLGGTFLTTGTIWCLVLAYSASFMTGALRNNSRMGTLLQRLSGTVLVGLGLNLAFNRN
jgi:threonine/homoserine/homoserine lactone efflux protein